MDLVTLLLASLFTFFEVIGVFLNYESSYTLIRDYTKKKRVKGSYILSEYSTLSEIVNPVNCARLCDKDENCLGLNYCNISGLLSCDLIPILNMKPLNTKRFKGKKGCVYFHKGPCSNGGIPNINGTCSCPLGYAGDQCERYPQDCVEAYLQGYRETRTIFIQPDPSRSRIKVRCVLQSSPETHIFKRRFNRTDRFRNKQWKNYRNGFSSPILNSYWIGLENIRSILLNRNCSFMAHVIVYFRNETTGYEGFYNNISVASENENYTLTYTDFSVDINVSENALEDGFSGRGINDSINGQPFCTVDRDCWGCSINSNSSGWWFNSGCSYVNPAAPLEDLVWPRNSSLELVETIVIRLIADISP